MKLLLVHNTYLTRFIGGEDLVFQREVLALQSYLGKDKVFVYTVKNDHMSKLKLMFQIWGNRYHAHQIANIIKQNQIDLVHVHNYFPLLTPLIFKAAKSAGAKVVHTLHNFRPFCLSGLFYVNNSGCTRCASSTFAWKGVLNRCYRHSFIQSFVAALAFKVYDFKRLYQYIDAYFYLTPSQKTLLEKTSLSRSKLFYKPNFVDVLNGEASKKMQHAVEVVTGIAFDGTIQSKHGFLFVGRLEEAKGIEAVLEAWSRHHIQEKLYIIGQGPLEDALKIKFKALLDRRDEPVVFLGQLPVEYVYQWMLQSRYLIQSSLLNETFGLTLIEAMSLGTPVIGFKVGTRLDFIRHGENGFLTSPESLHETIGYAASYFDYQTLSNGAKRFASQFKSEPVLAQQIKLYQDILEKA